MSSLAAPRCSCGVPSIVGEGSPLRTKRAGDNWLSSSVSEEVYGSLAKDRVAADNGK